MSGADKLIAKMRNNPRDWQIDTLVSIADKHGIEVRSHGGSHYIFSHPRVSFHLSVPAHRPIKPVYVKQFIDLVDAVKELEK
ncbi:MAG: addiction module toxin, HicA family [Smithella sp.]|jgi:predicted RNA binding protein YcfA (HicA-like mRNA interferase family)|nr:addiction module toxin, HicA family [Smithella sp.]